MKKNSLLKTLLILFGLFVVLSYIIPAGYYDTEYVKGGINPVGIFDLFKYPVYSIAMFIQYGLVILAIGIFYGILSKTGVYSKLCDEIVEKHSKNKKIFLGIIIFIMVLLSSVVGNPLVLFIFVPFIYNISVLLGFNKKASFAASVGSILVGSICSICGSNIALVNNEIFELTLTTELAVKIIFFIIVTLLYINFVILGYKEENVKKAKIELAFYEKNSKSKKSILPIKILLITTILITLLGVFSLNELGFTLFKDMYNSLMSFDIKGFYLFKNIFNGLEALGSWSNYDVVAFIIIMSAITAWVYGISFDDIKEGIKEGVLKTYKPALYAIFAGMIFTVLLGNEPQTNIMETINNYILTKEFSVPRTSLATVTGSIFYNEYAWLMQSGFKNALLLNGTNNYFTISFLAGSLHSLLMLIFPTSVLLASGLAYTDLEYTSWLKYIWKFLLFVLALIIVIVIILVNFMG